MRQKRGRAGVNARKHGRMNHFMSFSGLQSADVVKHPFDTERLSKTKISFNISHSFNHHHES